MNMRHAKKAMGFVLTLFSMSTIFGCAGIEYNTKQNSCRYLYIHKELQEADRAVTGARQAGKDTQCPVEYKAAEDLKNKAYDVYAACHTQEGIALAREATAKANGLCPRQPAIAAPVPEAVLEPVIDTFVYDEALGGDTGLAIINSSRLHGRSDRALKVSARHYDECIAAAEFQHCLLDLLTRGCCHAAAGANTAGDRDCCDPFISDETIYPIRADQQRLKRTLRKTGATEDIFDCQSTLRHIRCVLKQANITRHQPWCRETEHLPERKVPGHNRQHRAKGLVANKASSRVGAGRIISQEICRILCVVAACACTLFRFLYGCAQRLALPYQMFLSDEFIERFGTNFISKWLHKLNLNQKIKMQICGSFFSGKKFIGR